MDSPAARRTVWGIHAVDLASGAVLFSLNADQPLTPASNTKLFSTALALIHLGSGYRFSTRVMALQAPDSEGHIPGDLRLVGGGDPTISGRAYPYQKGPTDGDPMDALAAMADHVARAGVKVVHGGLVGDDTLYPWLPYPESWSVGDLPWEYGAPVSALTFNDNSIALQIRAGRRPGDPVFLRFQPPVEYFTVVNSLRTVGADSRRADIDCAPGSRILSLNGSLLAGAPASTQTLAVEDPAFFAASAFRSLLEQRGITILGPVRSLHRPAGVDYAIPAGIELARRESPPLSEIVAVVDKVSQNLHAELLLREVARVRQGEATVDAARKELEALFQTLGGASADADIVDGSGLSRRTLVSARLITRLLAHLHSSSLRDLVWSALPVAGEDGTLSSRFRGVAGAGAIRAKTGSISHVAALSGYAGSDPARRIAFSIVANSFTAPASEVRSIIDRIVLALAEERLR
jgi:D-alanyl-D-alanine carboxypeptidase/D-alanyl-D-alanine-endopeptidase (penicillin-binding protein 4)